ncbi:MAG: hypothetical protein JWN41_1175 [Thermoleophilia bacterium]|nr:hypothetical protein [Thermoleophilia bacterium]
MSDATHPPSAWRPLIDEWVAREGQLRPHLPVRGDSVRVRDAVEVGDQAFVLLSFDVDSPWPSEENLGTGELGASGTAVIQAERVRQPWHERDSTRALSTWRTGDGTVVVHEHMLGAQRAFSGQVHGDASRVTLGFEGGEPAEATVVDGWFLAVVPDGHRAHTVAVDDGDAAALERNDTDSLLPGPAFQRKAEDAMYFSPLDLRAVVPLVQWNREGDLVVVATSLEQYDEGGILRLRLDGIRVDEDTFESWPRGSVVVDGKEVTSAICGGSFLADTLSVDVGIKPWIKPGSETITVRFDGLRGANGEVGPVEVEIRLPR